MSLVQVRDMLDRVCEFHGHLSSYYHQLSDDASQSRVKLILNLLSQHEQGLREGLEAYERDASKNVMDSWVDCPNCEEIRRRFDQLTSTGMDASLETVVELCFSVDQCLFDFYREGEEHAPNARVKQVFHSLKDLQEGEVRKLAWSATQINDA
ncbi:MAG: hypothetical protein QNJ40_10005 [Xanthomonadales bacterium]|nr:hypothetical protein [Xanthomonadales bacterium]